MLGYKRVALRPAFTELLLLLFSTISLALPLWRIFYAAILNARILRPRTLFSSIMGVWRRAWRLREVAW